MKKTLELQQEARENARAFRTYFTDLKNWEIEMKRKEAALNGDFAKDLPPVRSKVKRDRPSQNKRKPQKRIASSDYGAWEKFDVDKACEDIDMAGLGPASLDSKKSQREKEEKLREEALYEKERGNAFVKLQDWDQAIKCYNIAIELVKDEAIYYANRGLCYLKKDCLHQAETDCTEALKLDPTYVKALQRRASARERLGSLRAASTDLNEVLRLEPHNSAARRQLEAIKARMGTKGTKSKSSPTATPTVQLKEVKDLKSKVQPKGVDDKDDPAKVKEQSEIDKWRTGEGENINVMRPVKKPPHLRSKRALKSITIQEIPLGKSEPQKPPTRMKIIEIDDSLAQGDTNNNSNKTGDKIGTNSEVVGKGDSTGASPQSSKVITDTVSLEKSNSHHDIVPPVNSVQFMAEWKYLKDASGARSDYLSIIDPNKIPSIFENALESDVLSEILQILAEDMEKFRKQTITAYLKGLCRVKRFSALAMFLSSNDKQLLNKLLEYCRTEEKCSDADLTDLKNKFEL